MKIVVYADDGAECYSYDTQGKHVSVPRRE
jgi:hypothetical protein